MVRVAGLKGQVRERIATLSDDGLSPARAVARPSTPRSASWSAEQQETLAGAARRACREGASRSSTRDGSAAVATSPGCEGYFLDLIFPVLTPLAIDPAHPFPFIPNLGFTLALQLVRPQGPHHAGADPRARPASSASSTCRRARRRRAGASSISKTSIGLFIPRLFPGYEVRGKGVFRVDPRQRHRSRGRGRRSGPLVRERAEAPAARLGDPPRNRRVTCREPLRLHGSSARSMCPTNEVHVIAGMLALDQLSQLVGIDRPDLKFKPYCRAFPNGSATMAAIASPPSGRRTSLVHHPYESFDVVVQFLMQAAPIRMSWRSSRRSTAPPTIARS